MTTTIFQDNAELLVDRVVQAVTAGRRDVAVKLCLDTIEGCDPVSAEQLEDSLKTAVDDDTIKRIWDMAGELFHGEPARWRNLVGQLIKIRHAAAAYEVMLYVRKLSVESARAAIRIAIDRGPRPPGKRPSNADLMADCAFYGIGTVGKKRQELEAALTKAKVGAEAEFAPATVCRWPREELKE
jgi:hypothetical protein